MSLYVYPLRLGNIIYIEQMNADPARLKLDKAQFKVHMVLIYS